MEETIRQTRSHLMKLFQQQGFHPRTDLGQNFLIDLNLVEYIATQADLGPDDVVLEVGAGTCGLTTYLAETAGNVVSVEVDTNMHRLAKPITDTLPNVTLLNCDALKNKNHLAPEMLDLVRERLSGDSRRRLKLVSNLPYSIATPIVSNLVGTDLNWERMIVTIQWELAQRMTAKPQSTHYGALSIWLQSQCRVKLLKKLPPTVFWPRPKVHSAIMKLQPNGARKKSIHDCNFFHDFLRRLFHQRRKLLRSVVVGMYRKQLDKLAVDAILSRLDLGGNVRAEELNVDTLIALSNRLKKAIERAAISCP